MRTQRIIAAAAARGKENKRRVHLSLPGDDLVPLCRAQAMWGWSRFTGVAGRLRPCERCAAKAAKS